MGNILCKKKNEAIKPESQPAVDQADRAEGEIENDVVEDDPESHIVHALVERYLKDEHLNSKFIPDFIEKRIYSNMLRVSIGLLKDTLEHTKLEVLGHRITINVTPMENEPELNAVVPENNIVKL